MRSAARYLAPPVACICAGLLFATLLSKAALGLNARQFSDFAVTETYDGRPAGIDSATAPESWSAIRPIVKEIIRDDMAKGPNFAGDYYLSTVGCGSGCEAIFVIDVRDGRVYAYPEAVSGDVLFQKDSRLIILREDPQHPPGYLLFDEGEFSKIE